MTAGRDWPWPFLDPVIERHPSAGDLDDLWERFEIFEAMHHRQRVCNPMTEAQLERAVDALDFDSRDRVLDVACGPGEVLIQAHERGVVESIGIDLSPWMLRTAAQRSRQRLPPGTASPRWMLADAAKVDPGRFDVVICLGAEWIWHGSHGTVAALVERLEPGGRLAYGGPRLHFDADPEATAEAFGRLETAADVERRLDDHGLRLRLRIDPDDDGWTAYLDRGKADVEAWARRNPGERAERWIAEQAEWRTRYEAERHIVGWSVWIAEAPPTRTPAAIRPRPRGCA